MLLEAVRTKNEELAQTWKKSEQWATIEQLCSKKRGPSGRGDPVSLGLGPLKPPWRLLETWEGGRQRVGMGSGVPPPWSFPWVLALGQGQHLLHFALL